MRKRRREKKKLSVVTKVTNEQQANILEDLKIIINNKR